MGLSQWVVVEAESEEAPVENDGEGSSTEVAVSMVENTIDTQRRSRRGLNLSLASVVLAITGQRRTSRLLPHSSCDQECFCLPLRC
jgi:hypothetical protein